MRNYFTNWNYKKHAKFCTAVYLGLYAFDMTVSYFICKKLIDKMDEEKGNPNEDEIPTDWTEQIKAKEIIEDCLL